MIVVTQRVVAVCTVLVHMYPLDNGAGDRAGLSPGDRVVPDLLAEHRV